MNNVLAIASVVILEMIRRKDAYVLLFLTALITLLLGSVTFFGDPQIVRYLKEICLTLIWISSVVIAVLTAARQIPAERESRTIFPLLAKPVTRGQLIVGKFLGCWAACVIALLAFYAFFCVMSGTREQAWPLLNYFQAFAMHSVFCGVVVALALLGSVIYSAVSVNVTIACTVVVGILFLGRHLRKIAWQFNEPAATLLHLIYFAIPHLEMFDLRDLIIHNWSAAPWTACLKAFLYATCYMIFLLGGAHLIFRRKPLHT
ncbi:MAG: ABC transporter permease [Verrucomicrobiales bacterium]|nr:ABC transporter permease [Verrucomicrobiales bacterium]